MGVGCTPSSEAQPAKAVIICLDSVALTCIVCVMRVAATAAFHKSSRVMLAVMKFFLGQDNEEDDSDADSSDDEEETKSKGPSKEDIYKAFHKVR